MTSTPNPRRWRALALLCTALFMVILDATIVSVALPSIQRDLGFAAGDLQWVSSAYALSFGGLLLLGGRCADLLGRRRVFLAGTAAFGLASLACGLSWSPAVLVAARVLQGLSAAAMTPSALSILLATFDREAERNRALGAWGATGGAGGAAGALVGGPVTEQLGWQGVFLINLPVVAVLLVLAPRLLEESRARLTSQRFDIAGAMTASGALVLLVYAAVSAPDHGWSSARTLGAFAASAALLAAFVAVERRSPAPLVPLRVLRSRMLVGGDLAVLMLGMAAYGMTFILTLYAQEVLGYSPLQFGLASAVVPIAAVLASFAAQALVTRHGPRLVCAGSLLLPVAGGLLLGTVTADGGFAADLLLPLTLFGLGIGGASVAGAIAALGGARADEFGLASGLNTAAFQIGGALGVAVLSSIAVGQAGAGGGPDAVTQGYRAAFEAAAVCAGVGAVVAAVLLRAPRAAAAPADAAPETGG